jgi:methylenetetrahydrofolate dehydrogenase (NADP+) / methenyltetrahydrofolate cyclohydrolase
MDLKGLPVVKALNEKLAKEIETLKHKNIHPKLAVVRVGNQPDDIAYEKGIIKRFSSVDALVDVTVLPYETTQDTLETEITKLNEDKTVHGILLFRPLRSPLSELPLKSLIHPKKDVDGMGTINSAMIYEGNSNGFPPCTAQAVMEILDYYNIDPAGQLVAIIGRSLVVGKPLSMLILSKNATVIICHSKTTHLSDLCRQADILVACAGVPKMVDETFVHPDQIVVDVGIHWIDGKFCGDVNYEAVSDKVLSITPVPGGVGTVTTSVLLKHTVRSAKSNLL